MATPSPMMVLSGLKRPTKITIPAATGMPITKASPARMVIVTACIRINCVALPPRLLIDDHSTVCRSNSRAVVVINW